MTKVEVIDYIARMLWINGMGSKGGGVTVATKIVEALIAQGVLKVSE